ncbi:D-inositol 3-phosphate glycosyltransferase-like [Montipora capricornis]|uniref:D-inositol 3-phosphate glycosyltransferase-like n=1 Tax=Montipora capricornis TaxID=246305 RepID=UPI0035F1C4AC
MASASRQQSQELVSNKVQVTILASEWGSSKGGLSTINRELAIQLAKFPQVEITFFLPKCSNEDKKVALSHRIKILEAKRLPGYEEMDWLSFPPTHLEIDVIVGHGVKVGRQAQVIRDRHKCVWLQVVHTDPEELGMFKCYENPISKGEEKHNDEVELCKMADLVAGVGPKLAEAFRKYLRSCQKDQEIIDFTPGIFEEFLSVQQVPEERKQCSVLVFGRGDAEDFALKGFDIAARSVAALPDTSLVFVGAPNEKRKEIANRLLKCGVPKNRLRVRGYMKSRESLKELFYEVDLVLMPSRTEGFGLTGLEALSAGLPVIVSKNSGFGEALGNVPFGSSFVIDSEDPNAWTAAIKDIWNKNRQTRLGEAKALRDSYGTKYSWSEQCEDLFKKMINSVNDASCELQMSSEAQGKLKRKSREDQKDISFTDHGISQKKAREEEKESKQHAGVSAKELTQIPFTSESFPSSSVASHRAEVLTTKNCDTQA